MHLTERQAPEAAAYGEIIAAALRQELGGSHKAVKTLMRWTGASSRTAKNWYSGASGPSGVHLVALIRNSDRAFDAVLTMAARQRSLAPENIAAARIHIVALLQVLDAAHKSL